MKKTTTMILAAVAAMGWTAIRTEEIPDEVKAGIARVKAVAIVDGETGDYVPGRYANVREKAANTLKYAYSPNRMFEKIAAGEMSVGGYIGSLDPQLCEIAGFSGLDFVWIDMEHRAMTVKDILAMQMALEGTGCASLVRVRCEDFNHVKPILDIGVDGIIFPQISGYEAAVRAVEACRYPQAGGKRGICVDRQSGYGKLSIRDYLKRSETWPLIVIELEDRAGIDDLDRILTLKDVDAIMVGPSDLACSMGGLCLQNADAVQELVDGVAAKTRKAGKLFFSLGSLEKARSRGSAFYSGGGCDAASWRKMYAQATSAGDRVVREPKISVFAKFIRQTAKERGISLSAAADLLYDLGVRGYDCGPDEEDLDELAATKLKAINFYYFPDWFGTDVHDWALDYTDRTNPTECIAKAKRYGIPRIMVVPPNFTDGKESETEFAVIVGKMRAFVAEAKAAGLVVTVETFGGTKNCCSHVKYLKRLLVAIPDLKFALDSGNLYYVGRGEDILEMMEYAKGRIGHVHLKDQTAEDGRKYVTLGLGAVPNEKIVKAMDKARYDGWYTLENPVGDTYLDTVRQVAILKVWLAEAGGKRQ